MIRQINSKIVLAQIKAKHVLHELKNDSRGVSGIVAAVVLVLIAVLFAALFWDKLQEWFTNVWSTMTNKTNEIQ